MALEFSQAREAVETAAGGSCGCCSVSGLTRDGSWWEGRGAREA